MPESSNPLIFTSKFLKRSWAGTCQKTRKMTSKNPQEIKNKLDDKQQNYFTKNNLSLLRQELMWHRWAVNTCQRQAIFCAYSVDRALILHDLHSCSSSPHCCISSMAVLLDVHQVWFILQLNCVQPCQVKLVLFPPEWATWGKNESKNAVSCNYKSTTKKTPTSYEKLVKRCILVFFSYKNN